MTPYAHKRFLKQWALYDFGMAAFNTLISTFVFAIYVTHTLAPANGLTMAEGTSRWGAMLALAGLAVLLLSPIAGSLGARFPAATLRGLTVLVIVGTAGLVLAAPGQPLWQPLLLAGIATAGYELSFIPYSAWLPRLAGPFGTARWSFLGWAAGYFGGIVVLALALFLLIGLGKHHAFLAQYLPDIPGASVRATTLLAALWIALYCLPLLRLPDPKRPLQAPTAPTLLQAWRACAGTPGLPRFIVASALYRDGLATVFGFGAIYAAAVHGFALSEILVFGVILNLGSGLGALAAARLTLHPLTIVRISLCGLLLAGICCVAAPTKLLFWLAALFLSLWFGPAQAAGRAHLLLTATPARAAPALALYTVTGRAANFIGPALYSAAVALTGLQQAGMASVLLLFAAALWLMKRA